MVLDRVRRFLLAGSVALLLAACGGGSEVYSDFKPTRAVAFGDSMTYLGLADGTGRYTVNSDGTTNLWALQLAERYGITLARSAAGGKGYAEAHARVTGSTDARGVAASTSVKQQIDSFLAAGNPTAADLVMVGAGTGDLIAEGAAAIAGTKTEADARTAALQAARDLAAQVKRLLDAGAKHVVVLSPYNLGRTPWARAASRTTFLENLTLDFNDELKVALNGNADRVLFVDGLLQMNLLTGSSAYDSTTISCSAATVSASNALGVGTNKEDSSACTSSTLVTGYDAGKYLFADPVYPTPLAHRSLGNYAYDQLRRRW